MVEKSKFSISIVKGPGVSQRYTDSQLNALVKGNSDKLLLMKIVDVGDLSLVPAIFSENEIQATIAYLPD